MPPHANPPTCPTTHASAAPGAWPEASPDTCVPLLCRESNGWPGLIRHAVRLAHSGDAATRDRWRDAWPQQAAELFDALAAQRPGDNPLRWPDEESPSQQVERVLMAVFCAWDQRLEAERQAPPDTPHGAMRQLRDAALQRAAGRLGPDPQHPASPGEQSEPGTAQPIAQVQLLVDDSLHGALRGVLRLRRVPAQGAFLAFVPAPANALTFCTASFVETLHTVTRLLHRLLASGRAELQHQALEWNLHTPEQPLLAVEGPSAGTAFAVAALSLLQAHLDAGQGELRRALAAVALQPGLLARAGISIAIDDLGALHPVGAVPDKALAYQDRRHGRAHPLEAQHLFLHPDNYGELDLGLLPHVQPHPVASLSELLQALARAAQPREAFQQVLAQMPLQGRPEDDDERAPPPAHQRELLGRQLDAAWRERDEVRSLRDYLIVRWAYWAREDGGALHMRFVPLTLRAVADADGQVPRLPAGPLTGLAQLLCEVHDAERGEDRVRALLLQGAAGAGKSTLLQRHEQALALDGLRNLLALDGDSSFDTTDTTSSAGAASGSPIELPLYLPLASLPAEETNPLAWVRTWARTLYPAFDELHQLLAGHASPRWQRVQLRQLLDGLNELPEPPHMGRLQRAEQVVNRLADELKLRLAPLLSARGHHGFEQLRRVQQGAVVQVQAWPVDLVLKYVRRCFSEPDAQGQPLLHESGKRLLDDLQKPEQRSVLDLCRTPFNAAGQVRLWAGGRQRLVRHRADLYGRLLHQALLRELAVHPDTGEKHNPLFHDTALITDAERAHLQDPANWEGDDLLWPAGGGALLPGLFRQIGRAHV